MLKTTAQQLIESMTDHTEFGRPMAIGAVISQDIGQTYRMLTVPKGQVFLITHIVMQSERTAALSATAPTSPNIGTVAGINITDAAGTQQNLIAFLSFERLQTIYQQSASPTFRSSPPANEVVWRPKYAIPVPEGWTVSTGGPLYEFGNYGAVYGYLVDMDSARTLGYSVSTTATDADRQYGVQATSSGMTIAGKEGHCIRVLDVHLRMQGEVNGTTNEVLIAQEDGTEVFVAGNSNPFEHKQVAFSPVWYIAQGQDLVVTVTDSGTTSINISYEYVPWKDVPGDAWFACVRPTAPTPGLGTSGAFATHVDASTTVTCYYPKYESTKTSPLKGFQHVVKGYVVSLQKTSLASTADSQTSDQVFFTMSSGTTHGGIAYLTDLGSQPNFQLGPVFACPSQSQNMLLAVDGIAVPCKKDDGAIYVDGMTRGYNALVTPSSTASIDTWGVSLWGSTIPAVWSYTTENRGS